MNRQLLQYHPIYGHRFIPGLKARVDHEGGGYLVRTNASGFRSHHEFVAEKEPGRFRLLLFGDSYTAGDGVSNQHRYSDVLEELVPGLEVFNMGLPGTGTDQQYLVFRDAAPGVEHDLVVIGVMVENIRRVVARYRPWKTRRGETLVFAKPYFLPAPGGGLELHHVPVPEGPVDVASLGAEERAAIDRGGGMAWLRGAVHRLGPGARDLAQRWSRYQPVPAYERSDDPSWQLMKGILERWISEVKVPVIVCPIPLYQFIEGTASARGYQERFAELAAVPGVTVHDPLPDFQRHPPGERRRFRFAGDTHLTAAGHRVLAESLAPRIRSLMNPDPLT